MRKRSASMRVAVDEDICIGSQNCADECPAVFEIVDGKSRVKVDPVPAGEEKKAQKAVDGCPVSAISVVEE
jgi:ferredoxin